MDHFHRWALVLLPGYRGIHNEPSQGVTCSWDFLGIWANMGMDDLGRKPPWSYCGGFLVDHVTTLVCRGSPITHRIHVCYIYIYVYIYVYIYIYGNIYHQYTSNVTIYSIHGSYGLWAHFGCFKMWNSANISKLYGKKKDDLFMWHHVAPNFPSEHGPDVGDPWA